MRTSAKAAQTGHAVQRCSVCGSPRSSRSVDTDSFRRPTRGSNRSSASNPNARSSSTTASRATPRGGSPTCPVLIAAPPPLPRSPEPQRRVRTERHPEIVAVEPGPDHGAPPQHGGKCHHPSQARHRHRQLVADPGQVQRRRRRTGQVQREFELRVEGTATAGGAPDGQQRRPRRLLGGRVVVAPQLRRELEQRLDARRLGRRVPDRAQRVPSRSRSASTAACSPPRSRSQRAASPGASGGGTGTIRFATRPSTCRPSNASAVSVRRVSAATTRSGVSTSRIPVCGDASSARRSASSPARPSRASTVRSQRRASDRSRVTRPRRARRCAGNSRSRYPPTASGRASSRRVSAVGRSRPRRRPRGRPARALHRGQCEQLLDTGQDRQLVRDQFVDARSGQHRGEVVAQPTPRAVEQGPGVDMRGEQAADPVDLRRSPPSSASSASPREWAGSVETANVLRPDRARWAAVAAASVVFPTPPLPVNSTIRTARG